MALISCSSSDRYDYFSCLGIRPFGCSFSLLVITFVTISDNHSMSLDISQESPWQHRRLSERDCICSYPLSLNGHQNQPRPTSHRTKHHYPELAHSVTQVDVHLLFTNSDAGNPTYKTQLLDSDEGPGQKSGFWLNSPMFFASGIST
jgi:hypothetical protein